MNRISTHILDLGRGKPASGVPVKLERQDSASGWQTITSTQTDHDGRCVQLLPSEDLLPGIYRIVFDTSRYFGAMKVDTLYPQVEVMFEARAGESQFHIPLLLNANGYTTYRGT